MRDETFDLLDTRDETLGAHTSGYGNQNIVTNLPPVDSNSHKLQPPSLPRHPLPRSIAHSDLCDSLLLVCEIAEHAVAAQHEVPGEDRGRGGEGELKGAVREGKVDQG